MTKKSNVYTRVGDRGTTSLVGGQRVDKDDVRVEAYGTVDELNSFLGLLLSLEDGLCDRSASELLAMVQNKLFNVGGHLAGAGEGECRGLTGEHVEELERAIDELDAALPPLKGFVLPGGTKAAAVCNVCRTVCRRAERRVISLQKSGEKVDPIVLSFLNRLSDYLFVLGRHCNIAANTEEILWK